MKVTPSAKPVYAKKGDTEEFYVRMQNSTRPLGIAEAAEYIQEHFD
jgi:hypothetical protein